MIYSTLIGMEQREQGRELEIKREMYYIKPRSDTPPTPSPESRQQRKISRRSWNKLIKLFIILLVSPLLVYGGVYAIDRYEVYKIGSNVPASIKDKVDFPIYLPSADTDYTSFTYGDGVLIFKAGKNKDLIFTEQKKSSNVNIENMASSQQLVEVKIINSKIGKAISGITNGRFVTIIDASETLIIITINNPYTDIDLLLRSLRKI